MTKKKINFQSNTDKECETSELAVLFIIGPCCDPEVCSVQFPLINSALLSNAC